MEKQEIFQRQTKSNKNEYKKTFHEKYLPMLWIQGILLVYFHLLEYFHDWIGGYLYVQFSMENIPPYNRNLIAFGLFTLEFLPVLFGLPLKLKKYQGKLYHALTVLAGILALFGIFRATFVQLHLFILLFFLNLVFFTFCKRDQKYSSERK